jgi:hypothetical protein
MQSLHEFNIVHTVYVRMYNDTHLEPTRTQIIKRNTKSPLYEPWHVSVP